jgi:hypothetical protein
MKRVMFSLLAFSVIFALASFPVNAQSVSFDAEAEARIAPDSALYGIDNALKRIRLALAFSQERKAEIALKHAQERLAEIQLMIEREDERGIERARRNYEVSLERASLALEKRGERTSEEKIDFMVRAEKGIEVQAFRLAEMERINEGKREEIVRTEARLNEVREKMLRERDSFKSRLEQSGLSEDDINRKFIEEMEKEKVPEIRIQAAQKAIISAQECVSRAEQTSSVEGRRERYVYLLGLARTHLEAAETAFEVEAYGRAHGQATSSYRICVAAVRFAEGEDEQKIREEFERAQERRKIDERVNINVRCDNDITQVKVEIFSEGAAERASFELRGCASRDEIMRTIMERTSLTKEELHPYISSEALHREKFSFEARETIEKEIMSREHLIREAEKVIRTQAEGMTITDLAQGFCRTVGVASVDICSDNVIVKVGVTGGYEVRKFDSSGKLVSSKITTRLEAETGHDCRNVCSSGSLLR